MDFSIIIPAYNEENIITKTVAETVKVLENFGADYEIIVVDDGSTDKTLVNLQEYINYLKSLEQENLECSSIKSLEKIKLKDAANLRNTTEKNITEKESFQKSLTLKTPIWQKIIIKNYYPNQGKGYALKYGTKFAQGEFIMFLDADLDLHPSHISIFFEIMQKSNADVVIGSKLHKKSIIEYPKTRKFFSFAYFSIIKFLFRLPIKDTQTGIKLFKAGPLKECLNKVMNKKYTFDLELLLFLIKKGYKVCEAPVHLKTARAFGRIRVIDAFRMLFDTLRIFWRFYILNFYK